MKTRNAILIVPALLLAACLGVAVLTGLKEEPDGYVAD